MDNKGHEFDVYDESPDMAVRSLGSDSDESTMTVTLRANGPRAAQKRRSVEGLEPGTDVKNMPGFLKLEGFDVDESIADADETGTGNAHQEAAAAAPASPSTVDDAFAFKLEAAARTTTTFAASDKDREEAWTNTQSTPLSPEDDDQFASPRRSPSEDNPDSLIEKSHQFDAESNEVMVNIEVRQELSAHGVPSHAASSVRAAARITRQRSWLDDEDDAGSESSSSTAAKGGSSASSADAAVSSQGSPEGRKPSLHISGRVGHGSCINGSYFLNVDGSHCGRPIYIHESPIPEGFSVASGEHLHLYYHDENDAWAISPDVGSLDVVAFVVGDVLDASAQNRVEEPLWHVSTGNGDYEVDEEVTMTGPVVPKYLERTAKSLFAEDPDSVEGPALDGLPEEAISPTEQAQEVFFSPSRNDSKASSSTVSSTGYIADEDTRPSSPQPAAAGKAGGTKRKSLSRRLSRKIKKSVKRTYKASKHKLKRLGTSDTPCEALEKQLSKFEAADLQSRRIIVMELFQIVRRNPHKRDALPKVRQVLLATWRTLLNGVEDAPDTDKATYHDTIVAIMMRDEIQLHNLTEDCADEPWIAEYCELSWDTHAFAVEKLNHNISLESVLLFCAKTLAINYFVVPKLADVIVKAVIRDTPIKDRRSRRIGQRVEDRVLKSLREMSSRLPIANRITFNVIHQLAEVNVDSDEYQCPASLPRLPPKLRHPHSTVQTPIECRRVLSSWNLTRSPSLCTDLLWKGRCAVDDAWTSRFVNNTEAGFGFLCIFIDMLFKRARAIYNVKYFRTKTEQMLGINQQECIAIAFMPGVTELLSCFLRLSLTSDLALKRGFLIGFGPPNVIVNWSDRTAASVLSLSCNGIVLSCVLEDLMRQTSTTHVVDVLSLLASVKALFESYDHMHEACLPADLDISVVVEFIRKLLTCHHYVVAMAGLRWVYDCLDYFCAAHRSVVIDTLLSDDVMDQCFCHWEPGLRSLFHTLIAYRLFQAGSVVQQAAFLRSLANQLAQPLNIATHASQRMSSRIFQDSPLAGDLVAAQERQANRVHAYLEKIVRLHVEGAPCFAPEHMKPWQASEQHPERPRWASRYASQSLAQLSAAVGAAINWVKEHRFDSEVDELYPPVIITLPPLQNMTSMYSSGRQPRQ